MSLNGVSTKKAKPGQMRKRNFNFGGGVIMGSVFRAEKKIFQRGEGFTEVGMSLWTAFSTYVKGKFSVQLGL